MKNILKYIMILTLIVNVSCTSDNIEEYGKGYNSGWIEVSPYGDGNTYETTINYGESIDIPIKLNAGINDEDITVSYSVELVSGNVDNNILGEKNFIIESSKKNAFINFEAVDSDVFYTLKFTLISSSDSEYQIGLSDGSQPTEFVLHVTNFKAYDAAPAAFGDQALTYVAMVGRPDATHFVIDSLWGPDFVAWATSNDDYLGLYLNEGVLTVNPEDNSLTVTGDYVADSGSSGTYDPTTGILTFSFTQANLFGSGFQVDNVLTPQP